jgi:16S rRNA (adenine1518-N6/adenine1519-N6)-dimethyltransferase
MTRFVDPRVVLARHGLRPKRSFGQNFLVAHAVVEKIADLCILGGETRVVEIGAGLGTLTGALLDRRAHVVAVERDRDLVPVLNAELADDVASGRLEIVEADAATVDLDALLGDAAKRVLAGNLPYQITGRLLERAVSLAHAPARVDRVVVMVQREVADRLTSPAGGDDYGQLTVFVQAAFDAKRAMLVSSGSFHPRPEVDSAVVVLSPRATPRAEETPTFRAVVHAAFGARRKTLRNALAGVMKGDEERAAVEATVDLGRRGETLDVEEFASISKVLDRIRAR